MPRPTKEEAPDASLVRSNVFDKINQGTISKVVSEYSAIVHEGLSTQEHVALQSVIDRVRDGRILDIGMGAGRTTRGLLEISTKYTGVDYVQEMVDECKKTNPGVDFRRCDARSMGQFPDSSFDLVFFSCNGICMVDHAGRLLILGEVRRILKDNGVFIFSTCNRGSVLHRKAFSFPTFQKTINPLKAIVRTAAFVFDTITRLMNRLRYIRHEIHCAEYALVNDVAHRYGTMLYFISPDEQRKQLMAAGFSEDAPCFDLSGKPVTSHSEDGTLIFVARRA